MTSASRGDPPHASRGGPPHDKHNRFGAVVCAFMVGTHIVSCDEQ